MMEISLIQFITEELIIRFMAHLLMGKTLVPTWIYIMMRGSKPSVKDPL